MIDCVAEHELNLHTSLEQGALALGNSMPIRIRVMRVIMDMFSRT